MQELEGRPSISPEDIGIFNLPINVHVAKAQGKIKTFVFIARPSADPFDLTRANHGDGTTGFIWANKFKQHKDEFDQENDFQEWRNSFGALLLLPNGTNQSFTSDKYEDKLEHYLRENTFAQTLHPKYYSKNPNFLKDKEIQQLKFEPHLHFKKADIGARQRLVQRICEQVWSSDYFTT